jgi:hypothetical protein
MTTHQQDSSQPQQSQDSPHLGAGEGLMIVETVEAMLEGMFVVLWIGSKGGQLDHERKIEPDLLFVKGWCRGGDRGCYRAC